MADVPAATNPPPPAAPPPGSETARNSSSAPASAASDRPPRLLSLDALRGFDMFWIVGAGSLVAGLHGISQTGVVKFLADELEHKPWQGFTFFDLIFPLFVFIMGVSIVLSLDTVRRTTGLRGAWKRILVRGGLLFLFGLIYSGGLRDGLANVRVLGVLQRIGFCYTVGAFAFCLFRPRTLAVLCAGILLGYWALLTQLPVRDISLERKAIAARVAATGETPRQAFDGTQVWVKGPLDPGRNFPNHVDFQHLPGRKYDGLYDPEGLISNIPAIATCLFGIFAGLLLKRRSLDDRQKVKVLAVAGVISLILGFAWGTQFPIIKQLWTSSYVLVAAGWSALLLAAFYLVVDIWGYRRWAMPFVWIGMNPIALYLGRNFCSFPLLAERLAGGPIKGALGSYGQLLVAGVELTLSILFVWFLHRRRIFLRL